MFETAKLYIRVAGIKAFLRAVGARRRGAIVTEPVWGEGHEYPVYLRMPSTDIFTYQQIFHRRDYEFKVNEEPRTIIDAGANIGLASIYLANKFPNARIIALEPEASNARLLMKNVEPYKNIEPLQAALWHRDELIDIVDPGYGKWAFMTRKEEDAGEGDGLEGEYCHKIKGMTVATVLDHFGLEKVDLLKIDIEGAERELFQDASAWIERVDSMIVELHEFMKPGAYRSFYNGSNGFAQEWLQGENVYLTRGRILKKPQRSVIRAFATGEEFIVPN